eukprot:TRINITY_DN1513_c0_g1_i1.p1 TRINITY_DN1513_c0_g1~~TRINITY_DN1513_c0_g1_i1.p1  ORF type:complete len:128 (-),score=24.61 TRINITY_DN1513_c0_g1_i1:13-396(-)
MKQTQTITINIDEMIAQTASTTFDNYDGVKLTVFDLFLNQNQMDYFCETECAHDKYCKECLTQHYRIKTKEGDVLKVKCIDPSCEREVTESEVISFLTDDELKNKFRKFKRQKLLMLNENARFLSNY